MPVKHKIRMTHESELWPACAKVMSEIVAIGRIVVRVRFDIAVTGMWLHAHATIWDSANVGALPGAGREEQLNSKPSTPDASAAALGSQDHSPESTNQQSRSNQ
jgi:hypothetical protein